MPALRTRDTQSRSTSSTSEHRTELTFPAALEVTTDAPLPPALHIVSPTPRAFTFPTSHNLADSPYSTPSSSPFEPDHFRSFPAAAASSATCTLDSTTLPSQSTSTPPPALPQLPTLITRALTPIVADASMSPVAQAPSKRRKSTSSGSVDPAERRPKKGDEDYVKRPENAFILFRRQCCEDRQALEGEAAAAGGAAAKKQRQADLSKTISQQWKSLSAADRKVWEDKAAIKKREHEQLHPGYVYRPQRAKDKDGRARNKKNSIVPPPTGPSAAAATSPTEQQKKEFEVAESLTFTIPLMRASGGRSASMPTPPPYQTIQVPNVYGLNASCPTSPSLMPMISRRSAYPGFVPPMPNKDSVMDFDFVPNPSYVAPAAFTQFPSNLQSSEFLRNMWNAPATNAHHGVTSLRQLSLPTVNENMPSQQPTSLLPAHQIISPSTSMGSAGSGSGSSGPSSPANGPFTPVSAFTPGSHSAMSMAQLGLGFPSSQQQLLEQQQQPHDGSDAALQMAAQAEMDRQMEMQLQQEFAAFTWGGAWSGSNEPAVLTDADFDINCIPPLELGGPKYTESMALPLGGAGLEYGGGAQDFAHGQFHGDGLMAFDDMMTGQSY